MGGHIFKDVAPVTGVYMPQIYKGIKQLLPGINLYKNIGSAGYKTVSGDVDVIVDADELKRKLKANDHADARRKLASYLEQHQVTTKLSGRNVHIRYPFNNEFVQVDVMVVPDAKLVAPYHQHGLRNCYNDPSFAASDIFILISSIAKALGLKFDPFAAKLRRIDTNEVVARSRDKVAKILLGPNSSAKDLNTVSTILAALENDPMRDLKLAQAKADRNINEQISGNN